MTGPLDPTITAKLFLGTCALQGAYDYLAPNKTMELYGVKADAVSTLCSFHGNLLMWVIAAWGAVILEWSPLYAIGIGQLPLIVSGLGSLLSGQTQAAGFSLPGKWIDLGIASFVAHACLSEATYAPALVLAYALGLGVASMQCRVAPQAALSRQGIDAKYQSPVSLFGTTVSGHQGILATVLMIALVNGVDASKALGYSQIPSLISFGCFIGRGEFERIGFDSVKAYPWIAIIAITVATLAF